MRPMLLAWIVPSLISLLGITNAQVTPQGLHFVGVGYNILKGNPEGGDLSNGGIDPGLLFTRKIFQLTYNDNKLSVDKKHLIPDQVTFAPRRSCVQSMRKEVFSGTESYQKKLLADVQTSGGINAVLASFAFTQSARYEYIKQETSKFHNIFYEEKSVCNLGRARYLLDLARTKDYPVTQDFAAAICHLPLNYSIPEYVQLIDQWGTHIIVEIDLGTRKTERFKSSQTEFTNYVMENAAASVSISGSYKGFGASLSVNMESFRKSMSGSTKFGEHKVVFTSGGSDLPEPIATVAMTIDNALDIRFFKASQSQCTVSDAILRTKRANLVKALMDYPILKRAVKPFDPEVRIPITWPLGTYGIPMTVSGCPQRTGFLWHSGTRYQDTENAKHAYNAWSPGLHLAGYKGKSNMEQRFCMKTQERGTEYDLSWPKGEYCIFKKGSHCPKGFKTGYILWNDENSNNKNKLYGQVPEGRYDKDTLIYFCCRSDGFTTNAINLPVDKPFFLFKLGTLCQYVHGMSVRDEFFYWDTENWIFGGNKDKQPRPAGYIGKRDGIRLHYCYYYK